MTSYHVVQAQFTHGSRSQQGLSLHWDFACPVCKLAMRDYATYEEPNGYIMLVACWRCPVTFLVQFGEEQRGGIVMPQWYPPEGWFMDELMAIRNAAYNYTCHSLPMRIEAMKVAIKMEAIRLGEDKAKLAALEVEYEDKPRDPQ